MASDQSNKEFAQVHRVRRHFQGKLFSFESEDVTLPNGSRTELSMVRHPGSIAVVPLFEDNTVLMERQYRHAVKSYLLEIPAGTMEPGEDPLTCARRELEEETGYIAENFELLLDLDILPSYTDERIYVYLARGLASSRQNLDEDEIIEIVTYPLQDALKMIDTGQIRDGLTILSLLQAWRCLHDKKVATNSTQM
jgi:ADP-ribose pyrophosphatase